VSIYSKEVGQLSSSEKRALLEKLLKTKEQGTGASYPLSYGQQAWWLLHQMYPHNAESHVVFAARVKNEVDISALRRALQTLIDRHASLRTSFGLSNGEPRQTVHRRREVDFRHQDVSDWDAERLKAELKAKSNSPFDLEHGPVMRANLFTVSQQDHVLLLVLHHIAVDLWSITVLLHELLVLYAEEKEGRKARLDQIKSDYTDYITWQKDMLAGAEGERLWKYWEKRLGGELPTTDLPTDRPRPPVPLCQGSSYMISLDAALTNELKEMSRDLGATLYMVLLSAFEVLLYRYTNQEDLLVGSLVASGRSLPEFSGTVGFLDNPIALRANFSGNPSYKEFLAQVVQTVIEALEHQDFPFLLLVERLQPVRDASRAPLFQSMFILQRTQLPEEAELLAIARGEEGARAELGDLSLESIDLQKQMATGLAGQLDLTLTMAELDGRMSACFQYRPELFEEATIIRLAVHFRTLLESIVANPSERIRNLPMLPPAEMRRLLIDWNDTAQVPLPDQCLHTLFEAQAERAPHAVASLLEGAGRTYGDLNSMANKIAHCLRSKGVGPGMVVGVCMERSHEVIIGLLAILKAGGAYLPLDPTYPTERQAFMLKDAQIRFLLSQSRMIKQFSDLDVEVICLDVPEAFDQYDSSNLLAEVRPQNLAYVIYTSGSTGRPKGVMIDHRGAVNTILDINRRFDVGRGDRALALSSLSFDLSVYDIFGSLAAGATIVLPKPSESPDPADWSDLIANQQVTIWNSAPALMEMFLAHASDQINCCNEALRLVMLSGDWIPTGMPDQIRKMFNKAAVVSLGGATEGSIWSILYPIGEVDKKWRSIPYGRPMNNQRFYVLDAQLQPVPVGVVGQLYIGGIGVALGYLNRPEMTAERFVPDAFSGQSGARLYHTGDLGRYFADGNIEFLGRNDFQVKIRGFRIELGEIESALSQHSAIREAVVTACGSTRGDKRVIAYISPRRQDVTKGGEQTDVALWEEAVNAGRRRANRPDPEFEALDFQLLTERLNRLGLAYVSSALSGLGVYGEPGEEHTAEDLSKALKIVPRYHKAIHRWLEMLVGGGLLERHDKTYVGRNPLPHNLLDQLWDEFRGQFDNQELKETIAYFKRCGESLADVLVGKVHPAQLLFEEGAPNVAESFYQQAFRQCNSISQDVMRAVTDSFPSHKRIRILEVGAGVGSTTAWVLPVLPPDRALYTFTDVSKYFMEVGQRNFRQYPFIRYSLLDIERRPDSQGYDPSSFDVVIASSVLHATRLLGETLQNVRSLLAPHGLLLLIEETQFHPWFNVVGLQEGFDRFEDSELRTLHPMLSSDQWRHTLLSNGFERFVDLNDGASSSAFLGLNVILAQAPRAETELKAEELRQFLRQKLPEYMLPSSYVFLSRMPLTPNGKVDRKALPIPEISLQVTSDKFIAPRTPTEEILAGIWSRVLTIERVGINDNFFELGGDSLLATQCMSRIRNVLSFELPLHALFESPTVASLAEIIDRSKRPVQDSEDSSIPLIERDEKLVTSFAQQRLWFVEQLAAGSPIYNVPAVMRLHGRLSVHTLEMSLGEIIRRHEALRTTFRSIDGLPVQVVAAVTSLRLPVIDLRDVSRDVRETQACKLISEEARRPFDITHDPLFRAILLRSDEEEHILTIVMHHIVADGWSVGVIIKELSTLYDAFKKGGRTLPDLPIQYADFAAWQRRQLSDDVIEPMLEYWSKQLAGSRPLSLPTDHPRLAEPVFRGAKQSFLYPSALLESLKQFSQQEGATLFMTLLAAFKVLLFRYSRQGDISVGSPIANRNRVEIEGMIGFFLNTLVLRTNVSGGLSFRELLSSVRKVCLDAYAHQDLPFERLIEELQPERGYTHAPMFQVFFILQNAPLPMLEISDLKLSLEDVDKGTAKFDLELNMFETDQGLLATWIYSTELFEADTIARFSRHLEALLSNFVSDPDIRLDQVEYRTEEERRRESARQESKLERLFSVNPKAVSLTQSDLVKFEYLDPGRNLPLVVRSLAEEIELAEWVRVNRRVLEGELLKHGAILFRGFNVKSAGEFEQVATVICPDLFTEYGDLPREAVAGKVYTSTPYPQDMPILLHNESSHMHCWPMRIWFYCSRVAQRGGETPIADCRKIYQMLDRKIRERFERKRIKYVRNYTNGLDVNWRDFFRTDDRAVVEEYCKSAGIEYEWRNGGGLRTSRLSQAVAIHPRSREKVFFNQMQAHHIACLDLSARTSLLSLFKEEDLPRNVYYGDGSRIEDTVMQEVGGLYKEVSASFTWQEGDVLLLDNMMVAHGRNPFVGPRAILVTMGEMIRCQDVDL